MFIPLCGRSIILQEQINLTFSIDRVTRRRRHLNAIAQVKRGLRFTRCITDRGDGNEVGVIVLRKKTSFFPFPFFLSNATLEMQRLTVLGSEPRKIGFAFRWRYNISSVRPQPLNQQKRHLLSSQRRAAEKLSIHLFIYLHECNI